MPLGSWRKNKRTAKMFMVLALWYELGNDSLLHVFQKPRQANRGRTLRILVGSEIDAALPVRTSKRVQ